MALARRKGWIRLGIVFSLAWFLGVLVFAGVEYHTVQTDLTNSLQSTNPSLKAEGWEVIGQQTVVTNCGVREKQVYCSPRFANLALLAFGPITLAWILVLVGVYAIAWIHAGFKGDET